jgi:hypothetical protein
VQRCGSDSNWHAHRTGVSHSPSKERDADARKSACVLMHLRISNIRTAILDKSRRIQVIRASRARIKRVLGL